MKKTISLFSVAFLSFNACTSLKQLQRNEAKRENSDIRLPLDVVPLNYELSLKANPSAEEFSGNVVIDVELLADRHDLLLHAQDLEIVSVHVENNDRKSPARFTFVDDQGLARITFGDDLHKGHYRLSIAYRAQYRRDLSGLYKVNEGDESYLFTQFEPLSARKMFPCFDEPRFKTPFSVTVTSPKGQHVIANTLAKITYAQLDDVVHVFDTTKPLPTYLLAIAIGPFDVVEGQNIAKNRYRNVDIPFRGIATKGKGEKLKLALRETPSIVTHLEEYFGVAYPYQKLDVIAIPDFSAGAMENAGAITFREWFLLLDEKSSSVAERRGFYEVMAHELAHQWFGNSVTMPWWDDLWLNEAFATWLSHKIIDQMKPEYKSAEQLLARSHETMAEDSLLSARKIREPIMSNHDIHNAFDGITYSKGGAVLSMFENYLGTERFRDAVSSHIKRFENGSATSRDFLESLAQFSDPNLVNSAETFLNQTGVPRVKVNYTCKNKNGFRIQAEQSRYVPIGGKISANATWNIPMCVSYDEDAGTKKRHCFTLNAPTLTIDVASKTCPSFVMPNAKGQGYYRFSLTPERWKDLLSKSNKQLGEDDRLAIADSLVSEFYAGSLDFAFVAEGLYGLIDAQSSLLTQNFIKLMKRATHFWVSAENHPHAITYAHKALKNIYTALSKARDLSSDQISLKKDLARFLANTIKDEEVRLELSLLGNRYLHKVERGEVNHDDADLVSDALAVCMQFKDNKALENIVDQFAQMTNTVERDHLLFGLATSRQGKDADQIRSLVFNRNLRRNEILRVLSYHLANPRNQPATWQFIKANMPKLEAVLSKPQMANLPFMAEGLCDNDSAIEVQKFFSPIITKYEGGPRNLAEVIEQIEICAARKNYARVLTNRFFDNVRNAAIVERENSSPAP